MSIAVLERIVCCGCRRALQQQQQPRTFTACRALSISSVRRRDKGLPQFTETTSPDLDALLANVRDRIFVPSHLKSVQRRMVFRPKYHRILRGDTVTADIDGEEVTLQPIQNGDVPNSWKSIQTSMDYMEKSQDGWSNLVGLLAGMHRAGRKPDAWKMRSIIRKAARNGKANTVVEMARRGEATGVDLRKTYIAREVMWACRTLAWRSNWDAGVVEKACRLAEQVTDLIEDVSSKGYIPPGDDPRLQPEIMGVFLELTAYQARSQPGVEHTIELMTTLVERIVPAFQGDRAAETWQSEGPRSSTQISARADSDMMRWVPVWHGLALAKDVLGNRLPLSDEVDRLMESLLQMLRTAQEDNENSTDPKADERIGPKWLKDALA